MYNKRIKIFIIFCTALLLVCLGRLVYMQLFSGSYYLEKIIKLKEQRTLSRQLKTLRGEILDRNSRILAVDQPKFHLCISYALTKVADQRVIKAKLAIAETKNNPEKARDNIQREIDIKLEIIKRITAQCSKFGIEETDIKKKIKKINDRIWNLQTFLAWRRGYLNPEILKKYNNRIGKIPLSAAVADFQKQEPDEIKRFKLIAKIDIPATRKSWPLLEFKNDNDIFTAQVEFVDIKGIEIRPQAARVYPFDSTAAQIIGWVGPEQKKKLFAEDKLLSYRDNELSGRRPGIEYLCETILRGRRGEVVYDIDSELVRKTETRFGKDVQLTIDIELQKRIEEYLAGYDHNIKSSLRTAVVVIDVITADILAMVSIPSFNLNKIRSDYNAISSNPDEPLINRAVYKTYPPGSVIKPIILIAGLEANRITASEIISCPHQKAPKGWPSCWTLKFWYCHDDKWPNNARNAIKGSCNIYFSQLANRIKPAVLQQWLFNFGYGRKVPFIADILQHPQYKRTLLQAQGAISSTRPAQQVSDVNDLPPLQNPERRFFGIGQGNMRVTVLQVANAMATIARDGLHKTPHLFLEKGDREFITTDLDISRQTLNLVRDGMYAVINETGGTAHDAFAAVDFAQSGVKVYGKTGSTQAPENAWFTGFAEDRTSRCIAIALVIEKGQSGARDAAPLGRDIITFCIDAGYIGNK